MSTDRNGEVEGGPAGREAPQSREIARGPRLQISNDRQQHCIYVFFTPQMLLRPQNNAFRTFGAKHNNRLTQYEVLANSFIFFRTVYNAYIFDVASKFNDSSLCSRRKTTW
jgi:hypothetical protein